MEAMDISESFKLEIEESETLEGVEDRNEEDHPGPSTPRAPSTSSPSTTTSTSPSAQPSSAASMTLFTTPTTTTPTGLAGLSRAPEIMITTSSPPSSAPVDMPQPAAPAGRLSVERLNFAQQMNSSDLGELLDFKRWSTIQIIKLKSRIEVTEEVLKFEQQKLRAWEARLKELYRRELRFEHD